MMVYSVCGWVRDDGCIWVWIYGYGYMGTDMDQGLDQGIGGMLAKFLVSEQTAAAKRRIKYDSTDMQRRRQGKNSRP